VSGVNPKNKIFAKWLEAAKNYYHKISTLPDGPNKIIKGVALGAAFGFLPVPLVGIPVSYLLARLLHCSPVATVATVIFTTPVVSFFYTLDAVVGVALFGSIAGPDYDIVSENVLIGRLMERALELGYHFLLGSLVNALACYAVVYYILKRWINRKKVKDVQ
jgi:uncharacterized protein (DUF2062 family)